MIEVHDLSMQELDVYTRLNENQLRTINEPKPGLFVAESPNVIQRALDGGYEPVSMLLEQKHPDAHTQAIIDQFSHIPVYTADHEIFTKLTGFAMTRGILCAMQRKELPSVEMICKNARRIAVLENVMNPTNVGAIFRSAAALGMDAVLLTGGCSDPLYRRSARVSMGTVFQIPWTFLPPDFEQHRTNIDLLHALGFQTAAMALCSDSVNIDDPKLMKEEKLAVILGTEGEGLHKKTIESSDYTICIPMAHGVDSLNVAAASAVAFWQLGHKPQSAE